MAKHTDYGLAAYCASKSGITGMTRNLALELGKYGITANCILPGAIHTGMTAASLPMKILPIFGRANRLCAALVSRLILPVAPVSGLG